MFTNKIKYFSFLAALALTTSCNYLNVIPVEQPDTGDMIIDNSTALNFLYGCYGYLQNSDYDTRQGDLPDSGCDEAVCPQEWERTSSKIQWGYYTPASIGDFAWGHWYTAIGYCNLFLKRIEENNPDIDPNKKAEYIAEAMFLKAYYHFRVLQLYGPCPIIDQMYPSNINKKDIPGRSHFDYCVDYIVNLLDEAARYLPPEQPNNSSDFGRATSVICKALKARVLLLAASPLYNGEFPFPSWQNETYETPGYGKELVSSTYSKAKWERARTACAEAIKLAEDNNFKLFDVDKSEQLRENQDIPLPLIPGDVSDDFKKKVMMLRYAVTTSPEDGNRETIWGVNHNQTSDFTIAMSSMPHFILKNDKGDNVGGWGGLSPTLYTIENFFTANGLKPAEDKDFPDRQSWFESAGLSNSDIINLVTGREPRFYAWLSFDGDEYSPVIAARKPLICEMRNPNTTGYNTVLWGTRNYCVTGFLNKKLVHPNFNYNGNGWGSNFGNTKYPIPLIRMAELYLTMAECEAQLGNNNDTDGALFYLNKVRKRAGINEWTETALGTLGKTVLQAVLEERFVELYMEGQRYHDIRRYLQGPQYLSKECYKGLNAIVTEPSFTQFNTLIQISQPFKWEDRMYLLPIANSDFYSNPQMVQAPGY